MYTISALYQIINLYVSTWQLRPLNIKWELLFYCQWTTLLQNLWRLNQCITGETSSSGSFLHHALCWGSSADDTSGRLLFSVCSLSPSNHHNHLCSSLLFSCSISPSLLHPAGVEKVTVLSTTLQGLLVFSMPVAALGYWTCTGSDAHALPITGGSCKPQHEHLSAFLHFHK